MQSGNAQDYPTSKNPRVVLCHYFYWFHIITCTVTAVFVLGCLFCDRNDQRVGLGDICKQFRYRYVSDHCWISFFWCCCDICIAFSPFGLDIFSTRLRKCNCYIWNYHRFTRRNGLLFNFQIYTVKDGLSRTWPKQSSWIYTPYWRNNMFKQCPSDDRLISSDPYFQVNPGSDYVRPTPAVVFVRWTCGVSARRFWHFLSNCNNGIVEMYPDHFHHRHILFYINTWGSPFHWQSKLHEIEASATGFFWIRRCSMRWRIQHDSDFFLYILLCYYSLWNVFQIVSS